MPTAPANPNCSIVVPFFNEAENVDAVLAELRAALPAAEIIAVDDGSTDGTWAKICARSDVRGLRFVENRGQSAAMFSGLRACTAPVCGVLDGDGQNDPTCFPEMIAVVARGEADVVCGFRAERNDVWNRRAASKFANAIRRLFLHDGVRDTGCSQKVFRREAVELLVPFRGMHRYLPAIFRRAGLRIAEMPVRHRQRAGGVSKYNNWSRAVAGVYDLVGVAWLLNRKIPPPRIETSP
jgi:dolichol-phosphate mannosyltransferase